MTAVDEAAELDAAVGQTIEKCGDDPVAAVRALIVANAMLGQALAPVYAKAVERIRVGAEGEAAARGVRFLTAVEFRLCRGPPVQNLLRASGLCKDSRRMLATDLLRPFWRGSPSTQVFDSADLFGSGRGLPTFPPTVFGRVLGLRVLTGWR
jgi:hypothetical protein